MEGDKNFVDKESIPALVPVAVAEPIVAAEPVQNQRNHPTFDRSDEFVDPALLISIVEDKVDETFTKSGLSASDLDYFRLCAVSPAENPIMSTFVFHHTYDGVVYTLQRSGQYEILRDKVGTAVVEVANNPSSWYNPSQRGHRSSTQMVASSMARFFKPKTSTFLAALIEARITDDMLDGYRDREFPKLMLDSHLIIKSLKGTLATRSAVESNDVAIAKLTAHLQNEKETAIAALTNRLQNEKETEIVELTNRLQNEKETEIAELTARLQAEKNTEFEELMARLPIDKETAIANATERLLTDNETAIMEATAGLRTEFEMALVLKDEEIANLRRLLSSRGGVTKAVLDDRAFLSNKSQRLEEEKQRLLLVKAQLEYDLKLARHANDYMSRVQVLPLEERVRESENRVSELQNELRNAVDNSSKQKYHYEKRLEVLGENKSLTNEANIGNNVSSGVKDCWNLSDDESD